MDSGHQDINFASLLANHAVAHPDKPAITFLGDTLTYGELNQRAHDLAHHLLDLGVGPGRYVTIAEPNGFGYFVAFLACWKLGAVPQPVSSRLPRIELDTIVELAESPVVIGIEHSTLPFLPHGFEAPAVPLTEPLPATDPSPAWKAPTSGGSTGRPKLIVSGDPAVWTESMVGLAGVIGCHPGQSSVMAGPMYHNGPLIWSWFQLLSGGHLVLLPRFDAEATLAAVQEFSASSIYLVPTMMQRMWKLPDDVKFGYDISSLRVAFHLAEPCPRWLKEVFIDWFGAEVLWELYGGTEAQCFTVLDGNEWLEHPGSVGRPIMGELLITDDDGNVLPNGETGSVWMRSPEGKTTYHYVGAEAEERDGWECLGDMGSVDDDGYLYLADRRKDMILVGGANVFPAEIEAALLAHDAVKSCAVIGLPDEDKGSRIHAIVESDGVDEGDLVTFLADRLVRYKIPRTFEYVDFPLRDDAGKVRRSALVQERS